MSFASSGEQAEQLPLQCSSGQNFPATMWSNIAIDRAARGLATLSSHAKTPVKITRSRHQQGSMFKRNVPDSAMKKILAVVTAAAALAAAVIPAAADGSRRAWRGSRYAVGAISRNVITPYYYGYYGSHYSYVAPDPMPGPTYVRYI
jgi:hypothetical protein